MSNSANKSAKPPKGKLNISTDGGVAGEHASIPERELRASPTMQSHFNTFKANLIPFACWGVNDLRFQFGSSFVTPEIKEELQALHELIQRHTAGELKPPLSVFGHADPVGQDDFNKVLSGRRAQAIYGLLARNTDLWEELFADAKGDDRWGDPAIDIMIAAVAASNESTADSQQSPQSSDRIERIKSFQAANGLVVDGIAGPNTRKKLFRSYMDVLCGDLVVDPAEFLGQGADAKGKADFQGCSEFNPLLIFSEEEHKEFQQAEQKGLRNLANAPNRRVMVFLFQPGSKVTVAKWPCPRVSEGVGGCKKRFWSDGEDRRSRREPKTRREFSDEEGTFACRFYHRMSTRSPCETIMPLFQIRIFDDAAKPLPFAPCLVTQSGRAPQAFRASGPANNDSAQGGDVVQNALITLRDLSIPATVNVKWSRPKPDDGAGSPLPKPTDDFEYEIDVAVDIADENSEETSLLRLNNMGYVRGPARVDDIREFQRDYQPRFSDIVIDGTLNAPTQNAIREVHDACDMVEKGQQ